jgi:hypothetical protein
LQLPDAPPAEPATLIGVQVAPPPHPVALVPVFTAHATLTAPGAVRTSADNLGTASTLVVVANAIAPVPANSSAPQTPAGQPGPIASSLLPAYILPTVPTEYRPASGGAGLPVQDNTLPGTPDDPEAPDGLSLSAGDKEVDGSASALPPTAVSDACFLAGDWTAATAEYGVPDSNFLPAAAPSLDAFCLGLAVVGGGYLASPSAGRGLPERRRSRVGLV